jgi:hypothetical protein
MFIELQGLLTNLGVGTLSANFDSTSLLREQILPEYNGQIPK